VADILGIKWKKGTSQNFLGITGEKGTVYFHEIEIKIGAAKKTKMPPAYWRRS